MTGAKLIAVSLRSLSGNNRRLRRIRTIPASEAMKSILIVDDDDALREMLGALLRDSGFDVSEAEDRDSAIATVRSRTFDAITVDLALGSDDGMDVVAEVRILQPDSKIYVLTGMEEDLALEAAEHGADGFLHKHTAIDQLIGLLN